MITTQIEPPDEVSVTRMNPTQPMTVEALIDILSGQPQNAYVHLFSDAEGNQCRHLLQVETGTDPSEPWIALVPYD